MPRKAKNIYKRKDGRWEGRYVNGKKEDGRTHYSSVYGRSYLEIKEKLRKLDQQLPYIKPNKETFSDVIDSWLLTNVNIQKPATRLKYENLINTHIKPSLGGYKIQEVDEIIINNFIEHKRTAGRLDGKGGLSNCYINTMIVIIQSVITYAVEQDLRLPLKRKIIKPAPKHKEITVLNAADLVRLEEALFTDVTPDTIGILLSLNMGLRIGEVCALQWQDIDIANKILHVRHTISRIKNEEPNSGGKTHLVIEDPKTKSSIRDIPITTRMHPVLATLKKKACSSYVISNKPTFVSPRTYEYRYHKILKELGIIPVHYHALRHTFATRCIEKGMDVKTLSELLGHSSVNITLNTYVHSSMKRKREQLEKLI